MKMGQEGNGRKRRDPGAEERKGKGVWVMEWRKLRSFFGMWQD